MAYLGLYMGSLTFHPAFIYPKSVLFPHDLKPGFTSYPTTEITVVLFNLILSLWAGDWKTIFVTEWVRARLGVREATNHELNVKCSVCVIYYVSERLNINRALADRYVRYVGYLD